MAGRVSLDLANSSEKTRGEITLSNFAKGSKDTLFQVIAGDMAYNIIITRSWIHDMQKRSSTFKY